VRYITEQIKLFPANDGPGPFEEVREEEINIVEDFFSGVCKMEFVNSPSDIGKLFVMNDFMILLRTVNEYLKI